MAQVGCSVKSFPTPPRSLPPIILMADDGTVKEFETSPYSFWMSASRVGWRDSLARAWRPHRPGLLPRTPRAPSRIPQLPNPVSAPRPCATHRLVGRASSRLCISPVAATTPIRVFLTRRARIADRPYPDVLQAADDRLICHASRATRQEAARWVRVLRWRHRRTVLAQPRVVDPR